MGPSMSTPDTPQPLQDHTGSQQRLSAIALVAALLVGASTAVWGWPGAWLATAALPAVLLGLSAAHIAHSRLSGERLRLGFILMGFFLGSISAIGSVALMRAAAQPPEVNLKYTRTLNVPPDLVWESVAEPLMWTRWDASIGNLETGTTATKPGARYPSTMLLHAQPIPTTHVLEELEEQRLIRWAIELQEGTKLRDLSITLRLEPVGQTTVATYEVGYLMPEVLVRGLIGAALADDFENASEASLRQLDELIEDNLSN
ncbi:MAG: hypothetical protein CL940_02715 [Deltaproteobacteria bacterium]|nr:hypothetical protein [Deltaproteobacteria bacterium]